MSEMDSKLGKLRHNFEQKKRIKLSTGGVGWFYRMTRSSSSHQIIRDQRELSLPESTFMILESYSVTIVTSYVHSFALHGTHNANLVTVGTASSLTPEFGIATFL